MCNRSWIEKPKEQNIKSRNRKKKKLPCLTYFALHEILKDM